MKIVFYILIILFLVLFLRSKLVGKSFAKLFDLGNCIVSGMRGRGKDMAFCYVINQRKRNYISNVNYSNPRFKYKCFPLDLKVWNLSNNSYKDLVSGSPKSYFYPYPDGLDYFISDSGIYFPAQFATELAKQYKSETMFQALSRHLGDCNIHCNVQNPSRLWDKMREQSDIYIYMRSCKVYFKRFVHLKASHYSDYESFEKHIDLPFFGIGKRAKEARNNFLIQHGDIKNYSFWFTLPYKYDDRRFKRILESGRSWDDEL